MGHSARPKQIYQLGGIPKNSDGPLAFYTLKEQDEYLRELAESL